ILQSELVRENRSFSRDDILCAAAAGWNTTNQWRYIKKFGKQIEPEAVYIFFNLNYFSTTPVIIKSQEGDWNAFQFGEFNQVISNLSLLEFKLGQLLVWSATFGINYQEIKNFPSNQGYIESLNSLLNIKKWTSENEVSLKVFITPVFGPFEKYDKFGRAYDRAMQLKEKLKNQIDIIDIVPEFFTEENNSRQYALTHSDIGHPNSKGKQALIKKVLEKL
ncbi:MAG: hypothetical protein KDD35_02290, partial [Bdellovibrionales bacterium]|nr:hypothetical protein [Bdellovibrionales bacterium]